MAKRNGMPERSELLKGERDDLLRSLEDLESERQAGDIADDDYLRIRREYIARTSALLEKIDDHEHGNVGDQRVLGRLRRIRRRLGRTRSRRILGALVALWLVAAAALVALHFAGVRLPGQSATGSISLSQALVVQQELTQASDLAGTGNVAQAITLYSAVLSKVPHQHEALTYQGWLIRLSGLAAHQSQVVAKGDTELALAARVAPNYPDARGLFGVALGEDQHNLTGALKQFTAMARIHPPSSLVAALRPQIVALYHRARVVVPKIFVASPPG